MNSYTNLIFYPLCTQCSLPAQKQSIVCSYIRINCKEGGVDAKGPDLYRLYWQH